MAKRASEHSFDVLVAGGGPAGLSAALALAHAGARVCIVDPMRDPAADRRTSALMAASVAMLDRLDVWADCVARAAPLQRLRIIDDTGRLMRAPSVEFSADEIGEDAFGWNIANMDLVGALRRHVEGNSAIEVMAGTVEDVVPDADRISVRLADTTEISARLVVAADGRKSPCRAAAGIGVDDWSYDQAAVVVNLRHTKPHGNVSTEFHRPAGPFTLVPLPGNRSSLVWVERRKIAAATVDFDDRYLAEEIERLSHRILGGVEIDGLRGLFPLSGMIARRFARNRIALVSEAAHVVPPIGAQGLNLGLRDAASIAEIVADALDADADIGGEQVCADYDRARRIDVVSRAGAIDLVNRSLLGGFLPLQAARAAGLAAIDNIGPLRRIVMGEGISPAYRLPRLMRRDGSKDAEPTAVRSR